MEGLLRDAIAVVRLVDRRGVVVGDDDNYCDDGPSRIMLFPSVRQCNSGKRNEPPRICHQSSLSSRLCSDDLLFFHPPPSALVFRYHLQRSRRSATLESSDVL